MLGSYMWVFTVLCKNTVYTKLKNLSDLNSQISFT